MLTVGDKALLVTIFYLCNDSNIEDLRRFQTEQKIKKGSAPITSAALQCLVKHFEETGSSCKLPGSGPHPLSKARTSAVTNEYSKRMTKE